MFLFEGSFGNILHTGDCRLTRDCLQSLPEKYVARHGKAPNCCLDYIFLDCTFGKSSYRFPSKHSAIRQIINCIWNHPDAPVVYLACDMLGQEDILLEVSRTFGSKIYVDKATNFECFRSLMVIVPEIVSDDPSSRFHIFSGFPKLYERASAKLAEARSKLQREPLIIRPFYMKEKSVAANWVSSDQTQLTMKPLSGLALLSLNQRLCSCMSEHSSSSPPLERSIFRENFQRFGFEFDDG